MNVGKRFLLVGKINAEVTHLRNRPRSTRVNRRRCLTDTLKSYLLQYVSASCLSPPTPTEDITVSLPGDRPLPALLTCHSGFASHHSAPFP